MLPPLAHIATAFTKDVEKDFEGFLNQHATDKVIDASGELTEYAVPLELSNRYRVLHRALHDAGIFMGLLPKMALVTLVSVYDAYLGRLLRGLFTTKPEILNASNRQLAYAQLAEFGSIEAARDHILESEVEPLLRERQAHCDAPKNDAFFIRF